MIKEEIYKLCKKLNISDYRDILEDSNIINEQPSLSLGPPWYPGSKYGTISIKNFKF